MDKGFIFSLIFAILVGIFAVGNSNKVLIDLFFTEIEMSQAIVIIVSALLGAIIVSFLNWVQALKLKKEIKELHKKIESLEVDNGKLTSLMESREEEVNQLNNFNIELQEKNEEIDNNK